MKIAKYIPLILSFVLAFAACTDDDKVTFDPNATVPGQLNEIGSSYVFEAADASNIFETFAWGKTTYNFDAAVTYVLQADIQGKDFAGAEAVTSTNNLQAEVTVSAMNRVMVKLLTKYDLPDASKQTVEFRIKASAGNDVTADYTNVITTSITPYSADPEYPKVWVIGDYSGWNHDASQFLFDYTNDEIYEAWIFFDGKAASGFKVTGAAEWSTASGNWGLAEGQTPSSEASSITLYNDGGSGNITAYSKNYYKFSFNKSTLELNKLASMDYFGIIGDGVGGWGDNDDVAFEFDTEKQVFVATVTLVDGEIKFRADHKWDLNYGQLKDGESGILASGGDNIAVTAGTYKITVNLNNSENLTYKIESATALDPSKITAQVLNAHDNLGLTQNKSDAISWTDLDFGGQDAATVTYTVEMDAKGANFANAQTLGTTKETTLSVSGDKYLEAITALGGSIDTPIDVDIRVTATVSGITNVYVSNTVSFNLTIQTPPTYTTELYMIGEEFGNWNWESDGVVTMIPVNGVEGAFWAIRYINSGKGFKWAPGKAWNGDFAELASKDGYTTDSGNAFVATSGLYMIYIDMAADKITIEPAQVYGMGDCFGGWNAGMYPFTVTDNKASITTTGSSELRIYAGSTAATTDWWTREFIIIDGKIEYRGNGGDQQRITVEAGKTVTLDFNAGTGTIQ